MTGSGGLCSFGVTGWGGEETVAEEHGVLMREELRGLDGESQEWFSWGCASFHAGTVSKDLVVSAVEARKRQCVGAVPEGQGHPQPLR